MCSASWSVLGWGGGHPVKESESSMGMMGIGLPWRAGLDGVGVSEHADYTHSAETHCMLPWCQVSSRRGRFCEEQGGQGAWTHQAYDLEGEDKVMK